ncbi:unnamed protein product [Aureobasidium pullulans]|nr:unnamed protein product [Aureobasidium pullulans]
MRLGLFAVICTTSSLVTASSKAVLFGRPGPLQILQPELALLDDRLKIELATHAIQTASPPDIALVSMRNGTQMLRPRTRIYKEDRHQMSSILIGSWVCTNAQTETVVSSAWTVHTSALPVTMPASIRTVSSKIAQYATKMVAAVKDSNGNPIKIVSMQGQQQILVVHAVCYLWSQRTWDQWPNWEQDDPDLEMDEWPVAAMEQPEFSTLGQRTIRNSLRCITAGDNSRAGNLYKYFRQGQVQYSSTKGGKYTHLRLCKGELKAGDSFTVDFDLSEMSDTEIDEIVPYCKPNPDCTNDGQQFHLSDLVYVTDAGKAGRMGWPYDIARMNNYMVTGEDDPVEAFQVVVDVYGDERDMFAATVSKYRDTSYEEAGSVGTHELLIDQSITVSGLPRDLTITRRSDSDADWLEFVYGDPVNELAGFAFNSNDAGYSSQFDTSPDVHRYCLMTDLEDNDGDL